MAKEIERKFKVKDSTYKKLALGILFKQGFLSTCPERTVRVRIDETKGYLTIKGLTIGAAREEFEYEIPHNEAQEIIEKLCEKPIIEKHRYVIAYHGFTWEVDEFHGENEGLIVAKIELDNENQQFTLPNWVGDEITHDPRYYNSNLIKNPYCKW